MKKSRRKRRFIDGKVQLALILQVLKHWLMFLFGAFVLLSLLQVLFSDPNRSLIEHLETVWSEHALFFVVALLIIPVFVNDVINLSHRFVGPVLRVRGELRRLAEGESAPPIKLRKNDFWQGLAADFNAALATMNRDKTTAGDTRSHDDEQAVPNHKPQLVNSSKAMAMIHQKTHETAPPAVAKELRRSSWLSVCPH